MDFSIGILLDNMGPIFAFMRPMLGPAIGITIAFRVAFWLKSLFSQNQGEENKGQSSN